MRGKTIVCWYFQGNDRSRVSERWCRISSIHSVASGRVPSSRVARGVACRLCRGGFEHMFFFFRPTVLLTAQPEVCLVALLQRRSFIFTVLFTGYIALRVSTPGTSTEPYPQTSPSIYTYPHTRPCKDHAKRASGKDSPTDVDGEPGEL